MRTRNNTVIITGADLSPGHEYEVVVQAVSSQGLLQSPDDSPRNSILIKGKETTPSQPSSLTATGGIAKIYLSWDVQTDKDFDVMEVWALATDNLALAVKIAETKTTTFTDNIGSTGQTRYYWLRARNTSGKTSLFYPETNGVNATTTGVEATDIEDFAIDATKLFTNTIILTADVWSNNTPVAGQITWNTHYLVYGGAYYRVTGSSTALRYVYWDVGHTAGSGTVADPYITTYGTTATYTAATDRFVVVVNESGVVQKVWNASANMVIGSAFILNLSVAKLVADATSTNEFVSNTAQIKNAIVTDAKIDTLTVSKLTAGTMYSKTFTLLSNGTGDCFINSGKSDFTNDDTGFIMGVDDSDSDKPKFYIGSSTNYFNWTGTAVAIKGSITITGGSGIASLTDAGDLATKDTIAATDCDTTIIDGGKIITGLLTADNIQAGTLTGRVVQTAASGQRAVMDITDNIFALYDSADDMVIRIDDDLPGLTTSPCIILGDAGGGFIRVAIDALSDLTPDQYTDIGDGLVEIKSNEASPAQALCQANHIGTGDATLFLGADNSSTVFDVLTTGILHILNTVQITGASGGAVAAHTGAAYKALTLSGLNIDFDISGSTLASLDASGTFDAVKYKVNGAAGANFNGAVTNITVVDGLVTAVS